MRKGETPNHVPTFIEGELVTGAVTIISGLISAIALAYHLERDAVFTIEGVKTALVILAGLFAFGMAMTPMSLARAHGESIEGGSAQSAILGIVLLVMVVDGALQVHAAHFILSTFGKEVALWQLAIGAVCFQVSFFFVRGALYQARSEIRALIDAKAERLEAIRIREREAVNAKRREDYAHQKLRAV
jgi:hypothetical protein